MTVTPPDARKSPFFDVRQVIPVRLTTDAWTADGAGLGSERESYYGYVGVEEPSDE